MQLEIAQRLQTITPPGSFAVQRSAPAEALRIDVQGVGALELPLTPCAHWPNTAHRVGMTVVTT